jgi:small subunit ribosomal protein S6
MGLLRDFGLRLSGGAGRLVRHAERTDPSGRREVSGLRPYDVLVIVDPRLGEEEVAQLADRLRESLGALGGEVVSVEHWGKRRLTYELRKQREGSYVLLQVRAEPAAVREYERQLKLNESVLRFMTTRVVERRRKGTPAEPAPTPEPTVEVG